MDRQMRRQIDKWIDRARKRRNLFAKLKPS